MSLDTFHHSVDSTMTPNVSPLPSDALGEVETGSAYFMTLAHYQSVARRILVALSGGGRFVLLTGSPPPNGRLLSSALSKEAARTHTVIGIPCGRDLSRDDWRRLVPGRSGDGGIEEFSATALLVTLGSPLPLYVLEDADQLSDEQLQEFFAAWLFGEPVIGMAVLTVSPAFLARLERPALSFLIEGLAARMLFQHLGPDEIATFLRQTLREGVVAEGTFSADTLAAIVAASGGDPALVTRLAARALEAHRGTATRPLQHTEARAALATPKTPTPNLSAKTTPVSPQEATSSPPAPALQNAAPPASPPPQQTQRRRGVGRRLLIGTTVVIAYFAVLLVLGSFIPRYFRPLDKATVATKQHPEDLPSKTIAANPPASETETQAVPAPSSGNPVESVIPQLPAADATQHASSQPAATVIPEPAPVSSTDTAQNTGQASAEPSATAEEESPVAAKITTEDATTQPAPPPPAEPALAAPVPDTVASTSVASPAALEPAAPSGEKAISAAEIAALVARGDAFLSTGDIVSARLYYERAANAGDGHAAMLMAETFDPAFLGRAGVRGVSGDADAAATWYSRARELGDRDAERRAELLKTP